MNQRDRALEAAARMIDKRVYGLKAELEADEQRTPRPLTIASDLACILEAELLARYIREMKGKRLKPLT